MAYSVRLSTVCICSWTSCRTHLAHHSIHEAINVEIIFIIRISSVLSVIWAAAVWNACNLRYFLIPQPNHLQAVNELSIIEYGSRSLFTWKSNRNRKRSIWTTENWKKLLSGITFKSHSTHIHTMNETTWNKRNSRSNKQQTNRKTVAKHEIIQILALSVVGQSL